MAMMFFYKSPDGLQHGPADLAEYLRPPPALPGSDIGSKPLKELRVADLPRVYLYLAEKAAPWVGLAVCLGLLLISLNLNHAVAAEPAGRFADMVLRNGTVYTVDAVRSWAEAVAVSDERIVFVGTDREVKPWIGDHTIVVDLGGRMLLPGFHDSHLHPVDGGISLGECSLHDATSEQQVMELVQAFAREHPEASWIRGSGWQLPIFRSANPHKTLLDGIVPDRPVYLSSADGHSAWVNSRALEIAGVTRDSPDPLPGRIERDPATGEPTGTLREDAMDLVRRHLPEYTDDTRLQGLRRALDLANRLGITSLHEARAEVTHLGAYLAFQETQTGSIEIGKLADLVVLDQNLFEVPPQMIHQCRVLLTLLGGKAVHCDPAFPYAGPRFSLPGGVGPTP